MNDTAAVPTVSLDPAAVDDAGGARIDCPNCGRTRRAEPGVWICGQCGQGFTVERRSEA